jgi:hypothetical protein
MGRPAIPSLIQGPTGPQPQAHLDAIEVIQSVQDLGQSVPLTARKATFVRVYLGVTAGPLTVLGEVRVSRQANGPWTRVPSVGNAKLATSRSGSTLAQLQTRRDDIRFSLNFRLPPRFTRAGQLWVRRGRVRDAATGGRVRVMDPVGKKSVTFIESPALRLRVINLQYSTGTPPATFSATANDLAHLRSWLRRAYPVPNVNFSSVTVAATAAWPFTSGQANAQVAAIRALDIVGGGNPRTHYYGFVSDGGGFMRGSATGIPGVADPSVVASGPTGPNSWGWDNDGSYGDWYGGHELGHTFGRFHPGFCGESHDDAAYPFAAGQVANNDDAFVGLDVGDASLGLALVALPGTAWHDVMTYCPTQWVSSYAYAGIRDRLVAEAALFPGAVPAAPVAAGASAPDGPAVHIAALVNLSDRTGSIEHVTPLPGSPTPTPTLPPGDTRLALRTRTAAGTTRVYPVEFKPDLCRLPDEDEIGLVDAVIDVDVNVTAIELLVDGTSIATFETGATPGAAAHLQLRRTAAEGDDEEEGITVSRSALSWDDTSAAEGGRPTYIVQASTDGGQTWQTLAVGATQTTLQLDPADYADAEHVRFRVLTTNGISYTEASTEDLNVDEL